MLAYKRIVYICCISACIAGAAYVWHGNVVSTQTSYAIERVPNHVAIIMDGNRRWARERNLHPWIGHQYGIQPLKDTISLCIQYGIQHVTVYAFSQENFKRPDDEKHYLFHVISQQLTHEELPTLKAQGVRVNVIGDSRLYPDELRDDIAYVQNETRDNTVLQLNILFCYSGRHDIAQAVERMSRDYADGTGSITDMTPERISSYLLTADIPDPDLVIRTGGRHRISNFLLYQMAYSEIYFLARYWPDVTHDDICGILEQFSQTTRTFGG